MLVPYCLLSVWGLQRNSTSSCLGEGVQPIKRCFSAGFPCSLRKLELINRLQLQFDSCHEQRLGGFATFDVRVPSALCVGACLCVQISFFRVKQNPGAFPYFSLEAAAVRGAGSTGELEPGCFQE